MHTHSLPSFLPQTIAYTYILGACTIYLLTAKISAQQIFQSCGEAVNTTFCSDTPSCTMTGCTDNGIVSIDNTVWLLITAALFYPFIHIRHLSDAGLLSYIGMYICLYCSLSIDGIIASTMWASSARMI